VDNFTAIVDAHIAACDAYGTDPNPATLRDLWLTAAAIEDARHARAVEIGCPLASGFAGDAAMCRRKAAAV
jgi:hypothetical protein